MTSADLLCELLKNPTAWVVTESNEVAVAELVAAGLVRVEERKEFYGRRPGGREFVRVVRDIVLVETK